MTVSGTGIGSYTYTSTTQAAVPSLGLTKAAVVWNRLLETYVSYTLTITNTGSVPTGGGVLTDALPVGTELMAATEPYASDGSVVTWTTPSLVPGQTFSRTLSVVAVDVRPGDSVINDAYGARTEGMLTPTMGSSIEARVPWRVLILPVLKNWTGGGS
jgi:hypothetical protein